MTKNIEERRIPKGHEKNDDDIVRRLVISGSHVIQAFHPM